MDQQEFVELFQQLDKRLETIQFLSNSCIDLGNKIKAALNVEQFYSAPIVPYVPIQEVKYNPIQPIQEQVNPIQVKETVQEPEAENQPQTLDDHLFKHLAQIPVKEATKPNRLYNSIKNDFDPIVKNRQERLKRVQHGR